MIYNTTCFKRGFCPHCAVLNTELVHLRSITVNTKPTTDNKNSINYGGLYLLVVDFVKSRDWCHFWLTYIISELLAVWIQQGNCLGRTEFSGNWVWWLVPMTKFLSIPGAKPPQNVLIHRCPFLSWRTSASSNTLVNMFQVWTEKVWIMEEWKSLPLKKKCNRQPGPCVPLITNSTDFLPKWCEIRYCLQNKQKIMKNHRHTLEFCLLQNCLWLF